MKSQSIGIFDSGFGGLTVMKAICHLLPHENILYFGDTGRLPYGTKSKETILRYSLENARFLLNKEVKILVVACHTACSFALKELEEQLSIPVMGVTIPAIEHVSKTSSSGRIAVLGTHGTIRSGMYEMKFRELFPDATIISIPCQLLVHLVEEGYIDHPITHAALHEYLKPLQSKQIDTLLLGCTHFPVLQKQIEELVGPNVRVIDPAEYCAQSVKAHLTKANLLNDSTTPPHYEFFVSDDVEKFRTLGARFLEHPLISVKNA
jgi:glutamate racemase